MKTTKTPEEYIERNIKTFLEKADKTKVFGTSYVQRTCGIGYNQAEYTIAEMLNRKLITLDDVKSWNYTFRQVGA